ncbi:glycoside hydrolase family protein [Asticcacaulis solisilvae]|uniref:glycoside hydrolase family protein n=1 Tax=Asticcacaulis solisilvae TaxID=1217274 RepID=UPI003FD704DF
MALRDRLDREEGNVLTAYPDPLSALAKACRAAGINPVLNYRQLANWRNYDGAPWTIGRGHTGADVHEGLTWTQSLSDAALDKDIADARADLGKQLPWTRQLDGVRRDVLVDMAFNMGIGKLLGFKETLRLVEAGRYTDAAGEMLRSAWANQVGARAVTLSRIMRTGHDE